MHQGTFFTAVKTQHFLFIVKETSCAAAAEKLYHKLPNIQR